MLLTHPEGDGVFDRLPLYDCDLSGIEFSIVYEDRARSTQPSALRDTRTTK